MFPFIILHNDTSIHVKIRFNVIGVCENTISYR